MASIDKAFEKVLKLEFANAGDALHYNKGEKGYTYMGVYEHAHPEWSGWIKVRKALIGSLNMTEASKKLYADHELTFEVMKFYKEKFWDRMRLDEVKSQKIAEEMFVFAVNAGIGTAVKAAQGVVRVVVDGVLGSKTIAALNGFDESRFDKEFDQMEAKHYEKLAAGNTEFEKFLKGWKNRAVAV